jgi:hypothetical protein
MQNDKNESFVNTAIKMLHGTPEQQTEVTLKSVSFDAVINDDIENLIRYTISLAELTQNTKQKVRYYSYAIDNTKNKGEFFLEVCYNIANNINGLDPDQAHDIYEALAYQKEFKSVLSIINVGYKKPKRGRPKKAETSVQDPLKDVFNEWQYPDSSSITKYMYDPKSLNLFIQFEPAGKVYTYINVPRQKFESFHNADSKGKYFGDNIKFQHSVNYTMR